MTLTPGMTTKVDPITSAPQGKQYGVFPRAEPEADAFAIQAVVGAHVRAKLLGTNEFTRPEAREHTVELFRRALGA